MFLTATNCERCFSPQRGKLEEEHKQLSAVITDLKEIATSRKRVLDVSPQAATIGFCDERFVPFQSDVSIAR